MRDELEEEDFPWPREGDDPFLVTPTPGLTARITSVTSDEAASWWVYAEGFKRLADLGVAQADNRHFGRDYAVYAIVWNYRHFLELSLKLVALEARTLLEAEGGAPTGHDLLGLWSTVVWLLRQIESGDERTYRNVRNCLARFNAIDPTSEEFRYPVRADGRPSLAGIREIDLTQLYAVMEHLATFFEGVNTQLSVDLDHKSDALNEHLNSW